MHSSDFGRSLLSRDDFGLAFDRAFHHFVQLQRFMMATTNQWYPCGGYLMSPKSMDYDPALRPKQLALFKACVGARNVLEIGVHGGHSLLIALLASDTSTVTCIDIGTFDHTIECVKYLQSQFPGRITYIRGDSTDVLPRLYASFDVVHVDGDHSYEGVRRDLEHAVRLSHAATKFVIDDYYDGVKRAVDESFDVVEYPGGPWSNCVAKPKNASARF